MTGFSAAWLDLRAPADSRARSATLINKLLDWRQGQAVLRVCDLGAGAGANLGFLAPQLGGGQHWTLIDQDQALLDLALQRGRLLGLERLTVSRTDMAAPMWLAGADLAAFDLVTASALLDLVSADWLDRLLAQGAAAGCAFLFALTYDGRVRWSPQDAEDAAVVAALNRHQRSDKGFGPALGPDAASHAEHALTARDYRVSTAASDWRLGPAEAGLQQTLAEGWVAAARELEPARHDPLDKWLGRRRAWIDAGRSSLEVGHVDLFARP